MSDKIEEYGKIHRIERMVYVNGVPVSTTFEMHFFGWPVPEEAVSRRNFEFYGPIPVDYLGKDIRYTCEETSKEKRTVITTGKITGKDVGKGRTLCSIVEEQISPGIPSNIFGIIEKKKD